MTWLRRVLLGVLVGNLVCWCSWALGGEQRRGATTRSEVVVRFSHVVAPDTPKGRMVARFKELVEQRSRGRIRVEVYPDSQLYGDDDEIEALRLGAVEMLAPSLSKLGVIGIPEFEVFDLPFLFTDLDQVRRLTQGAVGKKLLQRLERLQMVGLGYLDNGFKQMSADRPLRYPSDFKGLRLRVQASHVLAAQMRALGGYPVALTFAETLRALRTGLVDGTENPLSNFLTQGLATVQHEITLTQHGYLGYVVMSHTRFWNHLKGSDRLLLRQALSDALEEGNRLSAEMNQNALNALQRMQGVHVHTLPPDARAALRRAVEPVYEDFARRVSPIWWRDVQQTLLRAGE